MTLNRRHILAGLSATTLSACATAGAPSVLSYGREKQPLGYLFKLGVASGDPLSDGFVIWTRLCPQVSKADGGLPGSQTVIWEVADDEGFTNIVKRGETIASEQWSHSVHVEVDGLRPLRGYFYRFIADGQSSPVGRAKTSPILRGTADRLRLAMVSCQHYEQGFFTPYDHIVNDDPDIILHMGDYIYEGSWGPQVRRQAVSEAMDLSDYRLLHAQYKTDEHLQAAHAAASWLMIWDDHEVANDYAGDNDENYMPREQFLARRAAAYQAYYEHMPVRLRSRPKGPDMRFYNYFHYGDLMTMALTDTRQYRDDHACQTPEDGGGQVVNCAELQAERSIFGAHQERWLMGPLARSGCTWDMLAQPTLFSRLNQTDQDGVPGAWSDGWDGYPKSRQMILDAIAQRRPKNFVALGGDMHSWWQADLKADYDDPNSRTIGTEFVTSSVTSHSYAYGRFSRMLPDNPHIHFFDDRKRGYALMDLDKARMNMQFREVDTIYSPQSSVTTRKNYIVESGTPKAYEA